MKRQPTAICIFASLLIAFQAAHAQSSFVASSSQQVGNGTSVGNSGVPGGGQAGTYVPLTTVTSTSPNIASYCTGCSVISLNQFAAVTDVNNAVAGVDASIAGINLALQSLKKEAWTGTALAASLTPTLPTDGNQNHINFSAATAGGVQAVSANYSHIDGPYDFIAGAAISRTYSLAKVGVGFSW